MRQIAIYIFALALLAPLGSVAQMVTVKEKPSFYLGKRSAVSLNLGLQPTLSPSKPIESDPNNPTEDKLIPIYANVKSELTYSLALNNRVAFFVKGGLNKTSRNPETGLYFRDQNGNSYNYLREIGAPIMKGNSIGAGFSFFRKRRAALAPMGSHFSMGVIRHKYNVSYEGMSLVGDDNFGGPVSFDLSDRTASFRYYALEMSFATNKPITKELYYQLGFSSSFQTRLISQLLEENKGDDLEQQLLQNDIAALAFRDIVVLKLGLGYVF
jgi:hypothetical protein